MGKDTRIDRIDRALNFVALGDWVERHLIRFGIEMPVFWMLRGGDTNRADVSSKTGELDLGYPSSKGGFPRPCDQSCLMTVSDFPRDTINDDRWSIQAAGTCMSKRI